MHVLCCRNTLADRCSQGVVEGRIIRHGTEAAVAEEVPRAVGTISRRTLETSSRSSSRELAVLPRTGHSSMRI